MNLSKDLKRKHYIILAIVALLMLTNPSISSFKSYLHQDSYSGIGRDFNGLVFSVYSDHTYEWKGSFRRQEYTQTFYIGILGNFFKTPTL